MVVVERKGGGREKAWWWRRRRVVKYLNIRSIENVLTRQAAIIPTVGPATITLCIIHTNVEGTETGGVGFSFKRE